MEEISQVLGIVFVESGQQHAATHFLFVRLPSLGRSERNRIQHWRSTFQSGPQALQERLRLLILAPVVEQPFGSQWMVGWQGGSVRGHHQPCNTEPCTFVPKRQVVEFLSFGRDQEIELLAHSGMDPRPESIHRLEGAVGMDLENHGLFDEGLRSRRKCQRQKAEHNKSGTEGSGQVTHCLSPHVCAPQLPGYKFG